MIQIIAIISLIGLAIQTGRILDQEEALLAELQLRKSAYWPVWLYPLPPILPLLDDFLLCLYYPLPVAVFFYLPGIWAAREPIRALQRSGNPRAKAVESAWHHVVTAGYICVMAAVLLAAIRRAGF